MSPEKISRRKALKALAAAAGGLGAAAFLPAKWVKPVVESGVLPAHAATSGMGLCGAGIFIKAAFTDDSSGTINDLHAMIGVGDLPPVPPKTGTVVKYIQDICQDTFIVRLDKQI